MENQRYDNIDALRLFFAFCVVMIHVPMIGSYLLAPIYRCAVPFFYMVTGFFLYSKHESSNKLLIAAKKWFYLWLKYFAIITFLSIALHLLLNQNVTISLADVTNVIIGNSS